MRKRKLFDSAREAECVYVRDMNLDVQTCFDAVSQAENPGIQTITRIYLRVPFTHHCISVYGRLIARATPKIWLG